MRRGGWIELQSVLTSLPLAKHGHSTYVSAYITGHACRGKGVNVTGAIDRYE